MTNKESTTLRTDFANTATTSVIKRRQCSNLFKIKVEDSFQCVDSYMISPYLLTHSRLILIMYCLVVMAVNVIKNFKEPLKTFAYIDILNWYGLIIYLIVSLSYLFKVLLIFYLGINLFEFV